MTAHRRANREAGKKQVACILCGVEGPWQRHNSCAPGFPRAPQESQQVETIPAVGVLTTARKVRAANFPVRSDDKSNHTFLHRLRGSYILNT
jgi:hypothetical protein